MPETPKKEAEKKADALTLEKAQAQAKATNASGSRSAAQSDVTALLIKNQGKAMRPAKIAEALAIGGNPVTAKEVRRSMQKFGLSADQQAVLPTADGKHWIWLEKSGGRNTYKATKAGAQ